MITPGLPPEAKPGQPVALDLELFKADKARLHRPTGIFACLSVATDKKVWLVEDQNDLPEVFERLKKGMWVFQNAAFDLRQLARWAKVPKVRVWDTMLVDQDLFGGYYSQFGLDDLVRRWLGKYMDKSGRDEFEGRESLSLKMKKYATNDALRTLAVQQKQAAYMKEHDEPLNCYFDIDELMIQSTLAMKPVRVDVDAWMDFAKENMAQAAKLEAELGFNPKSPKQVMEVLHKFGFKVKSSDEATLQKCLEKARNDKQRELIKAIMNVRMYRDAVSKYGETWIEKNVEEGGLVYANWKIVGAETGRMSCRSPNLQQIPARELPIFRSFFVATKGHRLIISDVKQQEPRIAAWFSQDGRLKNDVQTGDVYTPIAKEFGIERFQAKVVFLGITYGAQEGTVARELGCSNAEAARLLNALHRRYAAHMAWIGRTRLNANRVGFVRTADGRRVWVNPYSYQAANNAINAPIQGSAAGMTKRAVNNMYLTMPEFCVSMVIHDEVVAEVPTKDVARYKKLITEAWMAAGDKTTPGMKTAVDIYAGKDWSAKG
jgi:DNA polymerase-1